MTKADTKLCTKCKKRKSLTAFSLRGGSDTETRRSWCRVCVNVRARQYEKTPKRRVRVKQYWKSKKGRKVRRNAYFKSYYNITIAQRDAMEHTQEGRCFICEQCKPLEVDHNHETNEVRKLLCHKCNWLLLSAVKGTDEIITAKNLVKYVKKYSPL